MKRPFSTSILEAWTPILEASKMPERPNFYVHCPTRTVEPVEPYEKSLAWYRFAASGMVNING